MDRNHDITAKTLKKSISLTDSDVQTFLEGKKTKSYVSSGFGNGISPSLEQSSTTGRFAVGRF